MAIDVKEWSKRLYDDVPWPEQRQFVEGVIDLIRAVIADEVAQQKRDQAAEKPATGDVPEWCRFLAERIRGSLGATTSVLARMIYERAEAEIAHRVEAASRCHILSKGDDCVCTLCLQTRHIAKLQQQLADAQAEVERLSRPVENETVIHHLPESRRYVPIANFVAERNAREAAEARERKLREFVRMRVTFRWPDNSLSIGRREPPLTDAELDRLLAAFDADGKVQA